MSRRFLFTLITFLLIVAVAAGAIFLAKGFRFSTNQGMIIGTGILSITSLPDQASIYLDGHLTSATNTNINSLPAKKYKVQITKEGYIPWEKEVEVKEGLVTQIKATLFRAIPALFPLTYTGAVNATLSPDGQKLIFVVPNDDSSNLQLSPQELKRPGLWIWTMGEKPITLARGGEPHQIALASGGIDYTKATFRFSPDSTQVLVSLPERSLLLDATRLNDPPRDITPTVASTLATWEQEESAQNLTRLQLIKDNTLRKTASESAYLKWAPDESKFLYSSDGKKDFKVVTLVEDNNLPTIKTYDIPQVSSYSWLGDSDHLVLVESTATTPQPSIKPNPSPTPITNFPQGKISVIEYDGFNKAEIYAGTFDPTSVFAWPDSSRIVIITSFQTQTASKPTLYGINLK